MPAASPWYCVPWYVASRSNTLGASSGMEGGSNVTAPMSTVADAGSSPNAVDTSRRPPPVSTTSRSPRASPSRAAIQARHRMPLPLISASPPSALRSSIAQSAPSAPGRSVISPSAPTPRWRSQSARGPRRRQGRRRRERRRRGSRFRSHGASRRASRPPPCQQSREQRARIVDCCEPHDAGIPPEPHALAPCERPGATRDRRERLVQAAPPFEVGEQLLVADRLLSGPRQVPPHSPNLVEQPPGAHGADARSIRRARTSRVSHTPAIDTAKAVGPNPLTPGPNEEKG